ncbi:hypothetical protein JRO89_XS09G0241700 [Xanthoceras sorbifolium]|uniref:GDSL esterase/lipase n=1 Tax=Xanthoceras sorbifolium TaxID=99658 RepID=A0ABQ8HMV9_9ROSI|nr:hypothetical protein JRO89_XS09G0241700 [Xanthoceras sorbifolium]
MATPTSFLLCVMIIFAATLMNIIDGCYGANDQITQCKLLFVIGDSLFDPGNNQYLMNGSKSPATSYPYGISMHNHSTGRLSDGLIVPDFIDESQIQLSNLDKVAKSIAEKVGHEEAKKVLMRSVYLISLGGNDYFGFNTDNPNATQSERIVYMRMVAANLTNGFKVRS